MLVLLVILIFIYHVGAAIYYGQGLEPSPTFEFLYTAAFVTGVVWWFRNDTKRSAITPIYCQGVLFGLGWLFIIPYHLLKTRGARGLFPLLALLGSLVISKIVAAIISIVSFGRV